MLAKYNDTLASPFFSFDPFRVIDELYSPSTTVRTKTCRSEATDSGLSLSVDLPGVKSKDLTVQATGREVRVEGTLRGEKFLYTYRVPREYDPETMTATLEDGVLTLGLQRSAASLPRTVEVQVK